MKQDLIDGLNEDLNLELQAVSRYLYHSASATGLLGHELREELKGDIQGELSHAVFLADKITALGGELNIDPKNPKKVRTVKEMMRIDIDEERKVVANYTKRITQAEACGDKGVGDSSGRHAGRGDRPCRGARAPGTLVRRLWGLL